MYKIAVINSFDIFVGYLESYKFYHGEICIKYTESGRVFKRKKCAENAIEKIKITGNFYFILEEIDEV